MRLPTPKETKRSTHNPTATLVNIQDEKKGKEYIHLDSGYCPLRKPRSGAWVRPAVIIYQQYIQQEKKYLFDEGSRQVNSAPSPHFRVPKNLVL